MLSGFVRDLFVVVVADEALQLRMFFMPGSA